MYPDRDIQKIIDLCNREKCNTKDLTLGINAIMNSSLNLHVSDDSQNEDHE